MHTWVDEGEPRERVCWGFWWYWLRTAVSTRKVIERHQTTNVSAKEFDEESERLGETSDNIGRRRLIFEE